MENILLPILKYKMNKEEAAAFRMAVLYLSVAHKVLPNYKHAKFPKSGDPRKSNLFKCAYKFYRENKEKLSGTQWCDFIQAQLQTLKNNQDAEGVHARIGPEILYGKSAWPRYEIWKREVNQQGKILSKEQIKIKPKVEDAIMGLYKTKMFFERKKIINQKYVLEALEGKAFMRWLALGHISPFYAILSPAVLSWVKAKNKDLLDFGVDLSLYSKELIEELTKYFKQEFPYEFPEFSQSSNG